LVGIWLSGCSADSTRLSESPFSNPFATASNDGPAPTPRVASAPLPTPNAEYAAAAHPSPVAVASLPPVAPVTTGQIRSAPPVVHEAAGSANGWTAIGGSPVVVAQSDTLETLSRRYGVPASAMLKTNGLSSASEVRGGMHLVVPVYSASAAPVEKPKRIAAEDASEAAKHKAKAARDVVAEDAADAKHKAKGAKEVAENEAAARKAEAKAKKHEEVAKADAEAAKHAKASAPARSVVAEAKTEAKTTTTVKKSPGADPMPTASVHPTESAPAQPLTAAQADAAGVAPEFRWPARGRIIEGFKAGGNDGINIAVPEGTSVRAAESGVVAYAGSELKGYGNLVLIRHPNGFVTAYANNGELDVKRGETVKRGQVIAKSGQSGNVNSPQLHFELRKGSTPVDPTSYLAGL
jgi:murein DD-endopeptidase MepM/ murein hydrolase activator NlpD